MPCWETQRRRWGASRNWKIYPRRKTANPISSSCAGRRLSTKPFCISGTLTRIRNPPSRNLHRPFLQMTESSKTTSPPLPGSLMELRWRRSADRSMRWVRSPLRLAAVRIGRSGTVDQPGGALCQAVGMPARIRGLRSPHLGAHSLSVAKKFCLAALRFIEAFDPAASDRAAFAARRPLPDSLSAENQTRAKFAAGQLEKYAHVGALTPDLLTTLAYAYLLTASIPPEKRPRENRAHVCEA
jgi:hypothetical protein